MRVRIGNLWFDALPGQPIMVELAPSDKANIANMAPDGTRYAIFNDDLSVEERRKWIEEPSPKDSHS